MNETSRSVRHAIRDELTCRAWYIDGLAANLGINESTCASIIRELKEDGLPVQVKDDGMHLISFPKGRTCAECGCILSVHNPCGVCNLHGGGCYDDGHES